MIKYKNSKHINFVDNVHYNKFSDLSIGQYMKRILKINNKISIRMFDIKDCINRYFEFNGKQTEENIDSIIRDFKRAGCNFDGYSINSLHQSIQKCLYLRWRKLKNYIIEISEIFENDFDKTKKTGIWVKIKNQKTDEIINKLIWWKDNDGIIHDDTEKLPFELRDLVDNAWLEYRKN